MPQAIKHGDFYLTPEGGHAVSLTNNTGSASVKGQLVRADSAAFYTCEVDETPIGVVYEAGVANGKKCLIVVGGRAQVLLENSTSSTANDWLYVSDTAGRATSTADAPGSFFTGELPGDIDPETPTVSYLDVIGRSLQTVSGGTSVLVWAIIHIQNSISNHGGTPGAHASSHEDGGTDEIDVTDLSGLLADAQTPLGHHTSHEAGGSDSIKLDDLASPDDNLDLNATTSGHGLLPKLDGNANNFLNGEGNWILVEGNTLDDAYDQGGAGEGRAINVDTGPILLSGTGGSVIELEGHATFTEINTPSNQTYKGALYSKRVSGDSELTELFYLDNVGNETQLTNMGTDPFADEDTQNTLDQAYDEGGAGVGRSITVDNGAVYLNASGNEALDLNGFLSLREISIPTNTANIGRLYVKNKNDGEMDRSELFYLDDQGTETQLTNSGYDPFDIGGTLDDAYDYGGGGAGRSITVDNDPVYLDASGGEALDLNGCIDLREISTPSNTANIGKLYVKNVEGDADISELFYLDDQDTEIQITGDGTLALGSLPAHAETHTSGFLDTIQLDTLGVPSDTVYLNATIAAHGLLPKLDGDSTHVLRGDGSWGEAGGAGTVDRFLIFSDDYEFTETDTSFQTKKSARVVLDSDLSVTGWRVVVSIWITGGGGDTAEVKVDIGGDSVTLTSTAGAEELKSGDITVSSASEDTLEDLVIQLKVTGAGGDTAHVKYTDIYAVYE